MPTATSSTAAATARMAMALRGEAEPQRPVARTHGGRASNPLPCETDPPKPGRDGRRRTTGAVAGSRARGPPRARPAHAGPLGQVPFQPFLALGRDRVRRRHRRRSKFLGPYMFGHGRLHTIRFMASYYSVGQALFARPCRSKGTFAAVKARFRLLLTVARRNKMLAAWTGAGRVPVLPPSRSFLLTGRVQNLQPPMQQPGARPRWSSRSCVSMVSCNRPRRDSRKLRAER